MNPTTIGVRGGELLGNLCIRVLTPKVSFAVVDSKAKVRDYALHVDW